jgi:Lrp/AsnC family transcriptional regulator, leucine-responsive regulatory protein
MIMPNIDRINLALIELLERDGRMSVTDLARHVRRAESTVRERLSVLEAAGTVKGYRALVDNERLGLRVRAVVRADCALSDVPRLTNELRAIPEVTEAQLTSGPKPLFLTLMVKDLDHLGHVMEQKLAPLRLDGLELRVIVQTLIEARTVPRTDGTPIPPAGAPVPAAPAPAFEPSVLQR